MFYLPTYLHTSQSADLFNFATDGAALLDAGRVLVQIEHRWIVVTVTDLDAERAEPGQRWTSMILGLHRHSEVRHTDLGLAVEHVSRPDHAGYCVDLEPVNALVSRLHQGVGHVAVGTHVQIHRFNLAQKLLFFYTVLHEEMEHSTSLHATCQNSRT